MKNPRKTIRAELEELRSQVIELRNQGRALEREHTAAVALPARRSDELTHAYLQGDDSAIETATEALRGAEEAARAPWAERERAAAVRVDRAHAECQAFASRNSGALWKEMEPIAHDATQRMERALAEVLEADRGLQAIEDEGSSLLVLLDQIPRGQFPQRGLDRIVHDVKQRAREPIAVPLPRVVTDPEPAEEAA